MEHSDPDYAANVGLSASRTGEFLIGVVAALFVVLAFLFFFYLYVKRYSGSSTSILSARFVLPIGHAIIRRGGLDPEAIQALPITLFRTENFKEGLECSVCLTELSDGEEARVLPKCGHGFHLECIDMWLHSHSTCPLCRSAVVSDPSASPPPQDAILVDIPVVVESGFAANRTGAMGESSRGSCSGARREGMLVIEIPRRGGGGVGQSWQESPLPTSRMQDGGEMKTPASGRMRSMRRMLSRGSRGGGGGGGGGGDMERGGGAGEGSRSVPRTPKDL